MQHPLAIRLPVLVIASTLAACGGSTPSPALTSALQSHEATQGATPRAEPTIEATATSEPTRTPTATPLLVPTGRILFSLVAPNASVASIYVMNADGSGIGKLPGARGGAEPAWSPDGKLVAFLSNGIWVMHSDGSGARQIRHDPTMVEEWPVWSPDGRQIAYLESPVCAPCSIGITWALVIMNADGSGRRKLTDVPTSSRPAWSPDGQTIGFGGRWDDPPTPANGLQSIRLDGSGLRQMTDGPDTFPAWSSDGRLAFLRDTARADDGTILYSLFVANEDGSTPREVHLPIVAEGPLAWSPDGGWIAMAGATTLASLRAGQWDIWIMHADASDALNLTKTSDRGEEFPDWH